MKTKRRSLRVIAAYSNYSVGDEVEPTGLLREQLIRQGLCEEIPADSPEEIKRDEGETVEVATVEPEERAVTRTAPMGRRRRRRKAQEARAD